MSKAIAYFANIANAVTRGALKAHFNEAATANDDDPRASEYRRLTGMKRDLPPLQYDKAMQLSFEMWKRNPIAKKLIDIFVDFCLGDEFAVKVKIKRRAKGKPDEDTNKHDAQKIWEDFEVDPVNDLKDSLPQFAQDLFINGELVLPAIVNRVPTGEGTYNGNGGVRIGYIDPSNVKEVVTDPNNVRIVETIKMRPVNTGGELIPKKVIRIDLDPQSETFNRMMGDCFYFRINRVVNQTRGHGIIVDLLDWIDAFDQFLFDSLEGVRLRNSFFYDLELKGLTDKQIEQKSKEIKPPRSGAVRVHNENAKYSVLAPDLKTQDIERGMLTFLTFIVGSKGFPIMWFGSGADTNRATAAEMAKPTLRMLQRMQSEVRKIVKAFVRFVCDQAEIAGQLKLDQDEFIDCEVTMVDLESESSKDVASTLLQLVQGLTYAVEKGWVSDETAKKLVDGMMKRLGVEVDPNETVEENRAERDQDDGEDAYDGVTKNIDPDEV